MGSLPGRGIWPNISGQRMLPHMDSGPLTGEVAEGDDISLDAISPYMRFVAGSLPSGFWRREDSETLALIGEVLDEMAQG